MKKILGIIAAILLCAAVADASPMVVATGPPDDASAAIGNSNADIGVIFAIDHNDVAGDIELWMSNTALFMGDEDEGLLKGPRAVALIMMQSNDLAITSVDTKAKTAQLEATPASATEVVNPANAGKIDAALFMGEEVTTLAGAPAAVIHAPRDDVKGSCDLICEI